MKNPKLFLNADPSLSGIRTEITLLDLAALFAIQGLIASWHITGKGDFPEDNPGKIVEDSFAMGRAFLEEREKYSKGESNA